MKKSVIILIGIIYILSIFAVSFLGLRIESFNQIVYVEKIEILNEVDGDECKATEPFMPCKWGWYKYSEQYDCKL